MSNAGKVRGLDRIVGIKKKISGRMLKPGVGTSGYYYVNLSKFGLAKSHKIHRLVADAFIPLDCERKSINHKDGNKLNNSVENLEWCTQAENIKHAIEMGLMTPGVNLLYAQEGRKKPINQYDLNGNYMATYPSGTDVIRLFGMNQGTLSSVCHKRGHTSRNFIWKFAKEESNNDG